MPVSAGGQPGKVIVKGLEDDAYTITEVATDAGYTLLKDSVKVVITTKGDGEICPICGKEGVTATATVNGDAVAMTDELDLPSLGERKQAIFCIIPDSNDTSLNFLVGMLYTCAHKPGRVKQ